MKSRKRFELRRRGHLVQSLLDVRQRHSLTGDLLVAVHHAPCGTDQQDTTQQEPFARVIASYISPSQTLFDFLVRLVPSEWVPGCEAPEAAAAEGAVELQLAVSVERVREVLSVELIDPENLVCWRPLYRRNFLDDTYEFDAIKLLFLHQRVKRERLLSAQESAWATYREYQDRPILPQL